MLDPTETIRRQLLTEAGPDAETRDQLSAQHGTVWDTDELADAFEVLGFMAPFVVVRRKADGVKGSMQFQHLPRFYFAFVADR